VKKRFSEAEIIGLLKDAGVPVQELWRKDGEAAQDARVENARLKKLKAG